MPMLGSGGGHDGPFDRLVRPPKGRIEVFSTWGGGVNRFESGRGD
jgi:hypothetical protein